jgi:hypothetical protein
VNVCRVFTIVDKEVIVDACLNVIHPSTLLQLHLFYHDSTYVDCDFHASIRPSRVPFIAASRCLLPFYPHARDS